MYFISIFLFVVSSLYAGQPNSVQLNGSEQHVKLTPHISYYLDHTSQLGEHNILSNDIAFETSTKEELSLGHQYHSNLWVTFTLENNSSKSLEYLLEYADPITYRSTLYDSNGAFIESAGAFNLDKFSKNIGHTMKITLHPQAKATYYMKVENPISSMKIKLSLWDRTAYMQSKNSYWNIVALLNGAMLALILYNLMLFFFTRDISYFYYVLVTSAMLFHELNSSGYILFFPSIVMPFTLKSIDLMVLVSFVFIPMFARSFLQLQTLMPRVDLYMKYVPLALVLVTFLTINEVIPVLINRILFVATVLSILFISYAALFKGVKQARYYVVGWTVVLMAFVSMALNRTGLLAFDPEAFHLTQTSLLFEALMFSVGLAARIRYTMEEKEASDANLILHQQNEKVRLEHKVTERTEELTQALNIKNLLLKEVHHRVKNNMQIIITLLRLQADQFDDKELEKAMSVSEQRIKAMALVHEMLYSHEDISEINVQEYFHSLVNEACSAYDIHGNVTATIVADISLDMERAIYTGLIINELVNNAYKYAFDSKGGEINISLLLNNGEFTLQVRDNGIGGDIISSASSLGMLLVNILATQQLKGSITTSTDKGVNHIIKFKNI